MTKISVMNRAGMIKDLTKKQKEKKLKKTVTIDGPMIKSTLHSPIMQEVLWRIILESGEPVEIIEEVK